jgi:ribosomal protein L37E
MSCSAPLFCKRESSLFPRFTEEHVRFPWGFLDDLFMLLFRGVATEKYIYFESMAEALPFIKKKVKNYTRILQSSKSRKTPGTRHRNQAPWQQSPGTPHFFIGSRGRPKILCDRCVRKTQEKKVSLISSCSFLVRSTVWSKKNPLPDTIASLYR